MKGPATCWVRVNWEVLVKGSRLPHGLAGHPGWSMVDRPGCIGACGHVGLRHAAGRKGRVRGWGVGGGEGAAAAPDATSRSPMKMTTK